MLLSELYPGYEWLEKVCFLPLSRKHSPEEFYRIMQNGLEDCGSQEFVQLDIMAFETKLSSRHLLQEAHLEFFHPGNSYWVCVEKIDGVNYALYAVKNNQKVIWIYLEKTNPEK